MDMLIETMPEIPINFIKGCMGAASPRQKAKCSIIFEAVDYVGVLNGIMSAQNYIVNLKRVEML